MFVDHIKIYAKAGNGGDGCSSFRREKFVPKGGPDGGDGGKGGDVILIVDHHTDNLKALFYKPHHKAERGANGKGQRMTGRGGKNLIVKVPPGTLVYEAPDPNAARRAADEFANDYTDEDWKGSYNDANERVEIAPDNFGNELDEDEDEEEDEEEELAEDDATEVTAVDGAEVELMEGDAAPVEEDSTEELTLVADLTEIGQTFVLRKGGIGGMGNWNYRSDTNQAPIETKPSIVGEEGWYFLELRKIADVGLVGFPNAGKSTLLRALSKATPKVAAYPFTTLKPMVGVVDFPGFMRTTIADIPGLIEGAHANVGLGHEFLRHITRCQLLMFVVDTAGVDQRDPISDIEKLRTEIKLYDEELSTRPWFIVANKADLEESEMYLTAMQHRFPKQEIISISAQEGIGLDHLRDRLKELVGKRPE